MRGPRACRYQRRVLQESETHMPPEKYRITSATIALLEEDGRHVAHMVPAGSIITIASEEFNGDRLVDVFWSEKRVMMFTQDIRTRGVRVE